MQAVHFPPPFAEEGQSNEFPSPRAGDGRGAGRGRLPVETRVIDACSLASLQIGAPTLRQLGVTSSIRGEGRSTVAIAMAIAQQHDFGRRTALLELDLDRPSLARRLGLDPTPGLAELIRGTVSLADAAQPWTDGISVVAAGAPNGRGDRLAIDLASSNLLVQLGQAFDVVVADLPPLLGCTYARLLVNAFERSVLVVRAGVTPVARIREATAELSSAPPVILNGTASDLPGWFRKLSHS